MICNSNDDLLEVFNIITIGDDDKQLSKIEGINKAKT